ncbi:50S ribosomal protein L24 [Enterobacteriaceae endosymbiont of Plateumaris consimilis]|uniref:50S ribosomal protein L24 n=1 Tax=Enterobacteriaceae endosymbiont of Plateumaris consimilis TaxID=2675794 RepID=UPI001449E6DC|nr:50S ribosomal protein L24 [Enterobacteriaceae endosymbiont of Plateumaris consimilis]QJC28865.1 50S ribosomal protein L24 [Enterobacteriaceae endosymbiont of Plateumaris consimilis]
MASKLRCNDKVIILAGKDKGKKGKIKYFLNSKLVIIDGINLIKKHIKPDPSKANSGGIIEKENFIHISNIAIFNTQTGKPDRIGFKFIKGKKLRFLKSNNKII